MKQSSLQLCPTCNTMKRFDGDMCVRCEGEKTDWEKKYPTYKSSCCGVGVAVGGIGEAHVYICNKCGFECDFISSDNDKSEEVNPQVTKAEEMDWEDVDFRFKNSFMPIKANYVGAPEDITEPILDFIHEAIQQAIAQERERIAEEYKNRRATIKWLWNKENTDEGKLGMVLKQLHFLSEVITNNHEDHKE